jgi:hypothetical protein
VSQIKTLKLRKKLHPELKERRVDACQGLSRRYEREGDASTSLKEYCHSTTQKIRTLACTGKVMLRLFWNNQGPFAEQYK